MPAALLLHTLLRRIRAKRSLDRAIDGGGKRKDDPRKAIVNKLTILSLAALLLMPLAALHAADSAQSAAKIELLRRLWVFNTTQSAQSTLTAPAPQA